MFSADAGGKWVAGEGNWGELDQGWDLWTKMFASLLFFFL
jgi:hypothetical protein